MLRSPPRRPSGLSPWRELLHTARCRLGGSGRLFAYLPQERRLLGLEVGPNPHAGPLDRRLPPAEELLDVLELEERPNAGPPTLLLTPQGRAELWLPGPAAWTLQRGFQLSSNPRASVVSAAWTGRSVIWCEEVSSRGGARRSCVCSRSAGPGLSFGAARVVLHNSPSCRLLAAGDAVYLLPDKSPSAGPDPVKCPIYSSDGHQSKSPSNSSDPDKGSSPDHGKGPSNSDLGSSRTSNLDKFILIWKPQEDTWTFTSLARGPVVTKALLPAEPDFRRLVANAAGLLPDLPPLGLRAVSASAAGLLVAAASGEISLVRSDGTVRFFGQLRPSLPAEGLMLMVLHGPTLAYALDRTVHLLDTETGRSMGETALVSRPLALLSCRETGELQALAEDGLYGLGAGLRPAGSPGTGYLETLVLEEACEYYQKRSLSRSRVTVERLKAEAAAFRAPAVLCSVLWARLGLGKGSGAGPEKQAGLRRALAGDMENYARLEEAKRRLARAGEAETATCVEEIAGQEVGRLLSCQPDRQALLNLRSVSGAFPAEVWRTFSRALGLRQGGDRPPSASATPDQWKALLGPPPSPDQPAAFELACGLMYRFQPRWLSGFVEQAQRQVAGSHFYHGAPLYKRALSVLPPAWREAKDSAEMAVELLLRSQRPNAVLQAVRLLLERGLWRRAVEVASRFSAQGPLLRKELFAALLEQLCRHRELDPFLPDICDLCPPDASAPDLLQALLAALPLPGPQAGPYPRDGGCPLTLSLLRPLLTQVLRRGTEASELPESLFLPPPTPPREKKAAEGAC